MIHARLCEFDERFALHASFGLAEFSITKCGRLQCNSWSVLRFVFQDDVFDSGLHIGTKTTIGGGFNVETRFRLTSRPAAQKSIRRLRLAITFTKP
jgi:hypothetical protein